MSLGGWTLSLGCEALFSCLKFRSDGILVGFWWTLNSLTAVYAANATERSLLMK